MGRTQRATEVSFWDPVVAERHTPDVLSIVHFFPYLYLCSPGTLCRCVMTLFSKSGMFVGSHMALRAVNWGARSNGCYRIRSHVPRTHLCVDVLASCGVKWHEPHSLAGSTVHAQWVWEPGIKTVAVDLAAEVQWHPVTHNNPCCLPYQRLPFLLNHTDVTSLVRNVRFKVELTLTQVCPSLYDSFPIVLSQLFLSQRTV